MVEIRAAPVGDAARLAGVHVATWAHGLLADGTEQTAWRADVPLEESRCRLPDLT